MYFSRREMLGLLAVSAVAGCSSSEPSGDGDDGDANADGTDSSGQGTENGVPGDGTDGGAGTSPAGSCASLFGDTMTQYDTSGRETIATFSYPMGGEITFEQSDDVDHRTAFGYGKGDISPLHSITVSERGPLGDTGDATEAYAFSDEYESGTVTTYGGQERPVAIRRTDDSVTYNVRVEGPDGFYEFAVVTAAGEADPCPETYESVTRRVVESFEPVA